MLARDLDVLQQEVRAEVRVRLAAVRQDRALCRALAGGAGGFAGGFAGLRG